MGTGSVRCAPDSAVDLSGGAGADKVELFFMMGPDLGWRAGEGGTNLGFEGLESGCL